MKDRKFLSVLGALTFSVLLLAPLAQADNFADRMGRQEGRSGRRNKNHKMSAEAQARADNATYRMTAQEQEMKTKHHGKLTGHDKRKLNRELHRNNHRMNNATK